MNRKVKLCRKSDFQQNQVMNNIVVLFVWFSFFSCFFHDFLVMFLLFLLSSSTRICFAFFMFSLWLSIYIFYTPFQFFSFDRTILPIELVKFDSRLQVFFSANAIRLKAAFASFYSSLWNLHHRYYRSHLKMEGYKSRTLQF